MDLGKKLNINGKKILIVGNRSYKNMGDEIILLGTIKLLQQQNKTIYISAYNPAWLKKFLGQFIDTSEITFLREIPKGFRSFFKFIRDKNSKILRKYKEVDTIIIGGGEILTEEVPSTYRYWLVSIFPCINKKGNKPDIYLMGGVQVPKKPLNIKFFDYLMKKVRYVYARDLESVYELNKYGFQDAEFFMDTSYFALDWEKLKNDKLKKAKYVVVNINKNGEKFFDDIANDVTKYLNQGYRVLYVPVAKGKNIDYSDMYYYKKLKQACKMNDKFEILDWEHDFLNFVVKLSKAEIVISTRLHLFLISSFLGVKTKVYPYQKKIIKMQGVINTLV